MISWSENFYHFTTDASFYTLWNAIIRSITQWIEMHYIVENTSQVHRIIMIYLCPAKNKGKLKREALGGIINEYVQTREF